MIIWFDSGNTHKKQELEAVLKAVLGDGLTLKIPAEAGIPFDPEESGVTFLENALLKARALHRLLSEHEEGAREKGDAESVRVHPHSSGQEAGDSSPLIAANGPLIIADDSGLCVDALDGRPGIYSARYGAKAGQNLADSERNALLLREVGDNPNRRARFVCAMVLLSSPDRFYAVQETLEGELIRAGRGSGGFGYDPILRLPERDCTVAELSDEEKNALSHRGKAARALAKLLGQKR
jgi:XTP/dITP diphosphohydrolase